jgi:hypothetical protein
MDRVPTALAILTALHHHDGEAAALITSPLGREELLALVVDLGDALLFEYERDYEATGRTVDSALQEMALIEALGLQP